MPDTPLLYIGKFSHSPTLSIPTDTLLGTVKGIEILESHCSIMNFLQPFCGLLMNHVMDVGVNCLCVVLP